MDSLLIREHHPDDCALLIALPLNKKDFKEDIVMFNPSIPASQARGDYSSKMVSVFSNEGIEKAWTGNKEGQYGGKAISQLCTDLIDCAMYSNVRVYVASRSSLLRATIDGKAVIVIIAHWKTCRVSKHDIRLNKLASSLASLKKFENDRDFRGKVFNILLFAYNLKLKESEIAEHLSILICEEAGFIPENNRPDSSFMDSPERSIKIGQVRDYIDSLLPDFIVPGNCLELRDGYYKAFEVANMFPENWSGIVELAVCHSVNLALSIKNNRDDRRVITNELAKEPVRCIPELQETFLRLHLNGVNYIKLRLDVFSSYSQRTNNVINKYT